MPRAKRTAPLQRNVALCYVRQSMTREGTDKTSPERQRANIAAVCKQQGWTPEWYQDAEGHKSGTKEKNRPGWLALKARLIDPDVVALVANDLARLHRKGWRVGDLLDFVEEHDIALILASPTSPVADLSSVQGRMMIQIAAMFDEWYAADLSQRQRDSISYRKGLGKVVGIVPFGTMRDKDGYLIPSTRGAWYMPDGSFQAGKVDEPPHPEALWRPYYECAKRMLTLYTENQIGSDLIAGKMQEEGWAYKDRGGIPRRVERDDVRRVLSNWPEYGGIVLGKRAKDRPGYEDNVEDIPFIKERAVFNLDLLQAVALIRHERGLEPANDGVKKDVHIYALHGLVYCAHCEHLAQEQNDNRLRTHMTGSNQRGTMRYVHKQGVKCGSINRSVPIEAIEADFGRLIKLLTVREDAVGLMAELAIQADKLHRPESETVDPEQEKQEAIALCKRRIDAAVQLYGDGRIDRQEYLRRVEQNEREIAHWEARTTETEKAALELAMCAEAVDKLARLWDIGEDEDKQGMARSLFSYIVYDLDIRRIVDFRLKPWAERFLVLRTALYAGEKADGQPGNENAATGEGLQRPMPLWGSPPFPRLFTTVFRVRRSASKRPSRVGNSTTARIRQKAHELREQGLSYPQIARALGVSVGTVWNAINLR